MVWEEGDIFNCIDRMGRSWLAKFKVRILFSTYANVVRKNNREGVGIEWGICGSVLC